MSVLECLIYESLEMFGCVWNGLEMFDKRFINLAYKLMASQITCFWQMYEG